MKKPGKKQITLYLSEDLHKKIKHHAIDSGSPMTVILLEWIEAMAKREIKK